MTYDPCHAWDPLVTVHVDREGTGVRRPPNGLAIVSTLRSASCHDTTPSQSRPQVLSPKSTVSSRVPFSSSVFFVVSPEWLRSSVLGGRGPQSFVRGEPPEAPVSGKTPNRVVCITSFPHPCILRDRGPPHCNRGPPQCDRGVSIFTVTGGLHTVTGGLHTVTWGLHTVTGAPPPLSQSLSGPRRLLTHVWLFLRPPPRRRSFPSVPVCASPRPATGRMFQFWPSTRGSTLGGVGGVVTVPGHVEEERPQGTGDVSSTGVCLLGNLLSIFPVQTIVPRLRFDGWVTGSEKIFDTKVGSELRN